MYTITSKSFANYLCQWSLLEQVNSNYNVFAIISKINLYLLCLYLKIKFTCKNYRLICMKLNSNIKLR